MKSFVLPEWSPAQSSLGATPDQALLTVGFDTRINAQLSMRDRHYFLCFAFGITQGITPLNSVIDFNHLWLRRLFPPVIMNVCRSSRPTGRRFTRQKHTGHEFLDDCVFPS